MRVEIVWRVQEEAEEPNDVAGVRDVKQDCR